MPFSSNAFGSKKLQITDLYSQAPSWLPKKQAHLPWQPCDGMFESVPFLPYSASLFLSVLTCITLEGKEDWTWLNPRITQELYFA